MPRFEGDAYSRLVQMLRGDNILPTTLTNATVTQVNPLAIRVFGDNDDTPLIGLIVTESLAERTVNLRLQGTGEYQTYDVESPLKVGDRVIIVLADDGQLVYVIDKMADM